MNNPHASDWDAFWKKSQKKSQEISWSKRRIINIIEPYATAGKKVLDAGCGSGFFAKYFCDLSLQTTALDYSRQALEIAQLQTENRANIVHQDLTSSDLKEKIHQRFDVIFSDGLLEHFSLQGQNKIIQNLYSLLNDDGIIITFVPNRFSPWQLVRPFLMPGIDETPFVLSSLVSVQIQNNLSIVASGGINTFPWLWSPDKLFGGIFGMLLYTIAKK